MLGKAGSWRKYRVLLFITVVFSLLCVVDTHAVHASKNILILNSYHKGLSWTDQETEGIMGTLHRADPNYKVAVEYMDWKNYPTEENMERLYSSLKYKYSQKKLDMVITTDDTALEFALKYRGEIFSSAPIVFCGVNEKGAAKITQGYESVTGVVEKVDSQKTASVILKIKPNIKDIYVLYDNTESGRSTGELTMNAIKEIKPEIRVIALNDRDFEDVLKEVGQAQSDSVVLLTTYYIDGKGTVIGFENSCRLISERAGVPVFHLYDFGIGYGALGGSMLSGKLQGESAAKIAIRVLQGENIAEIRVNECNTTRYIFDYAQLKKYNIPLEILPEESQIINKPFSFFETYRNLVVTVASIFLLMVVFIFILLRYLRKINNMKQQLYRNNQELTVLYEELTASDEELRQHYKELTETKENLMSSEERYALLFEKMLNGFFVFEPVLNDRQKIVDIRFISTNPGFEKQIGSKVGDIAGKTWKEVFKRPDRNLRIYENILQTGESQHFETYNPHLGSYYSVNAFKIRDNQVGVVFENITHYKQAIKEIKVLNEELEQRVAERTDELLSAVHELEAFSYTVSHDLKSPLRAVDGYSRIILEDFGEKLEDDVSEMILNIRGICKDMIEMINKLLQYSITSRSAISKEEISTEEIFTSIFKELKSTCPERDLKLIIETGLPGVMVDRVLFREVVYNILSNAVKFTRDREKALISVGCTITEEEYMFYVKDNGVGFDMEYSGKLFGIFQRLHTNDEFEGNGIGLVTVKKIIQKHGGRTWIEGKVDSGATVYFTLPFSWEGGLRA